MFSCDNDKQIIFIPFLQVTNSIFFILPIVSEIAATRGNTTFLSETRSWFKQCFSCLILWWFTHAQSGRPENRSQEFLGSTPLGGFFFCRIYFALSDINSGLKYKFLSYGAKLVFTGRYLTSLLAQFKNIKSVILDDEHFGTMLMPKLPISSGKRKKNSIFDFLFFGFSCMSEFSLYSVGFVVLVSSFSMTHLSSFCHHFNVKPISMSRLGRLSVSLQQTINPCTAMDYYSRHASSLYFIYGGMRTHQHICN